MIESFESVDSLRVKQVKERKRERLWRVIGKFNRQGVMMFWSCSNLTDLITLSVVVVLLMASHTKEKSSHSCFNYSSVSLPAR